MNQEKIGEFIKKLRKDNKLTQAEFAEKLGVTYQAVSKWETGKNIPDIAILKEISKIFDVNIDEIISGEKSKKSKKDKIVLISFIAAFVILTIVLICVLINRKEGYNISEIGSKCEKFKVYGTLVYDRSGSYIHIPTITFCDVDETIYDTLECVLYERNGDTITTIFTCTPNANTTLKTFLEEIKIDADNYKNVCKDIDSMEIYLEVNGVKDEKLTTYKIPLEVNKTCSK